MSYAAQVIIYVGALCVFQCPPPTTGLCASLFFFFSSWILDSHFLKKIHENGSQLPLGKVQAPQHDLGALPRWRPGYPSTGQTTLLLLHSGRLTLLLCLLHPVSPSCNTSSLTSSIQLTLIILELVSPHSSMKPFLGLFIHSFCRFLFVCF